MNKSKITVLLGAGAMYDCTHISTNSLTELVAKKEQDYFDSESSTIKTYPLLAEIKKDLEAYFHKDECVSFEDMLHMLEMMNSYSAACSEGTVKEFKSVFPAFTQLIKSYNGKMHYVYRAKGDLIGTIIEEIAKHETSWKNAENKWFSDFFKILGHNRKLDIFTLNYDTWLEQIYASKYCDGYSPLDEEYSVFSANKLFQDSNGLHTINHLHGQICFTTHHPERRIRYVWEDPCRLLKAKDFDTILRHKVYPPYGGSMTATQSGENVDSFPIITGLRKTEKITMQPFDAYFHHFYQSIMRNSKLLIIGYGFGDLYINSILEQFSAIHGDAGNAVVISYINKDDWVPRIYDNPAISHYAKQFYYHLYRETDLADRLIAWDRPDFIDSKDMSKCIYISGFQKTAERYTSRLLETLS